MKVKLFKNKNNLWIVEDKQYILGLVHKYIVVVEKLVLKKQCRNTESYEGVCYIFAKSIIEYAKACMDNVLLGHFHESNMINRKILENYVCFYLIHEYESEELWKYWIIYSYFHARDKFSKKGVPQEFEEEFFNELEKHNISKEYYEKLIYKNYGWTFPINREFTFSGLCKLIEIDHYKDFKFGSDDVHGTLLFTKEESFSLLEAIDSFVTFLFTYLQFLAETYCLEYLDDSYFESRENIYDYYKNRIHDN